MALLHIYQCHQCSDQRFCDCRSNQTVTLACGRVLSLKRLCCSAAAHLLQPRSEPAHRSLVLVDRVGVAIYQYGCAVALCLYSVDAAWTQSVLGQVLKHVVFILSTVSDDGQLSGTDDVISW